MLIASPRHTARDLEAWERRTVAMAQTQARLAVHRRRSQRSRDAILSFTGAGPCYAGVSWGKDSVVLAHLVQQLVPRVPLVWVRVEPDFNPDCLLVRDAFLAAFPQARYEEITVERHGAYKAHGTLERGMARAHAILGTTRYLSGVRGDESAGRSRRMRAHGESTRNTCAPLGWWIGWDVLAHLVAHDLPIHPAYACTMGGMLDPTRVRVGPLGGDAGARPGDGMGRLEWERMYYGEELRRLAPPPA